LGIGLNVRIEFAGTPFENTAISVQSALKRPIDRLALLTVLLMRIDLWSENLLSDELFEAWKKRLRMLGTRVSVNTPDGLVTGTAENVDEQGALLLRMEHGELRRVIAGDIALGE
jgi:BirA family transcriptional regulator, biotin operon repressor / biotin---[acetyl-CoA-carboxylase] ligase